jgi:hypothetical protein
MRRVTKQYHLKAHLLKQGPKVIQPVIGGMTESTLLCDCEVLGELRFHHRRHNFVRSSNTNGAPLRKRSISCDILGYTKGKF